MSYEVPTVKLEKERQRLIDIMYSTGVHPCSKADQAIVRDIKNVVKMVYDVTWIRKGFTIEYILSGILAVAREQDRQFIIDACEEILAFVPSEEQ